MSRIIDCVGPELSGAVFSEDRLHRYVLWRRFRNDAKPSRMLPFCGLNPSTADETVNDPTVSRCINYAKRWGYDGMFMLNIFAFRATDPRDMKRAIDPVGSRNDESLLEISAACQDQVLCCWGAHGSFRKRGAEVLYLLARKNLFHLGLTSGGHPKHPLYLKGSLSPIRWDFQ